MFVSADHSIALPDPIMTPHSQGVLLIFNLNYSHASLTEIQQHTRWVIPDAPGVYEIIDFKEIEKLSDSVENDLMIMHGIVFRTTTDRQITMLAEYFHTPSFIDLLAENLNMFQDNPQILKLPQTPKKRFNLEV